MTGSGPSNVVPPRRDRPAAAQRALAVGVAVAAVVGLLTTSLPVGLRPFLGSFAGGIAAFLAYDRLQRPGPRAQADLRRAAVLALAVCLGSAAVLVLSTVL